MQRAELARRLDWRAVLRAAKVEPDLSSLLGAIGLLEHWEEMREETRP